MNIKPVLVHKKEELEAFLLNHRELNFYTLGDLDDFFWPNTTCYALKDDEIRALILFYTGIKPPSLLAINNDNREQMQDLAEGILPLLPRSFYAHLSPGLEDIFQKEYKLAHHGEHYKMALRDTSLIAQVDTRAAIKLQSSDLIELQKLYEVSYPGNWFDARMLDTGQYFGIYDNEKRLLNVAGVHVYSAEYEIAALGNVTTHPDHRNQGLAVTSIAALCNNLLLTVDVIGLNVRSDNQAAIRIYQRLGFEIISTYNEFMLTQSGIKLKA